VPVVHDVVEAVSHPVPHEHATRSDTEREQPAVAGLIELNDRERGVRLVGDREPTVALSRFIRVGIPDADPPDLVDARDLATIRRDAD